MTYLTELIEEELAAILEAENRKPLAYFQREEEWEDYLRSHPIEKFEIWINDLPEYLELPPQNNQ